MDIEDELRAGHAGAMRSTWRFVGWLVVLTALTICLISLGEDSAFHFDVFPMDGTLRFYNPLRRISLGQRGGVDFQVFHGLALPYLFYPAYRLLGAGIFVAEMVRQFFMPLTLTATFVALFSTLTRSAARTMQLATLGVLSALAFGLTTLIIPGISVLGIRTALALFFIALLAVPDESPSRLWLEGLLLGLATALSTEQGVALVGAYTIVFGLRAWRARRRRVALRRVAFVLTIGLAAFVLTLTAIGGPVGALRAIRYNFGAVAQDQFWYFGALPTAFLYRLGQFFERPVLTLILLAGFANAAWWLRRVARARDRMSPRALALATLAVYGPLSAVPLLAMWVNGYADGLARALIITMLVAADARIIRGARPARAARAARAAAQWWPEIAGAVLLLTFVTTQRAYAAALLRAPWHIWSRHVMAKDTPKLSPRWQLTVGIAKVLLDRDTTSSRPRLLWSTYAGAIEGLLEIANPPFDYMTDALGRENRDAYLAAFRRAQPALVQTIDPRFSAYEEWVEDTSWPLYHELLMNYRVAAVGPWSIFWERTGVVRPEPPVIGRWNADTSRGNKMFSARVGGLPHDRGLVLEAEMEYRVTNPWAHVPLIGKLPRYLVFVNGAANAFPIPLAPYRSSARFPIVIAHGDRLEIVARVESLLPGAQLHVSSLRLRALPVDTAQAAWATAYVQASPVWRQLSGGTGTARK